MTETEKLNKAIQFIKDIRDFAYIERHNTVQLLMYPVLNKVAYQIRISCDDFLEHFDD